MVRGNGTAYGSFFFVFDPAKYPDVKYGARGCADRTFGRSTRHTHVPRPRAARTVP